jgi:dTDP-4-dehydrorhamnose reductase
MNVLVTGSNGYIGKSIIDSKINDVKFFEGSRKTIDLYNKDSILDFINKNKIDTIIHCAIEGGNRLKKDDANIFYNNLLMFENLLFCRNYIHKFINLASGSEFDRSKDIHLKKEEDIFINVPKDYYGLSKNIIAQKCLIYKNFHNLRIFGCFDENELNTRFIKSCIIKSRINETITIYEDKLMDFFYLKDLISVIEYFLFFDSRFQDINLSYENKNKLSQIAKKIINENKSKSNIIIETEHCLNYNGDFKKLLCLPIIFKGMEIGIKETIINVK